MTDELIIKPIDSVLYILCSITDIISLLYHNPLKPCNHFLITKLFLNMNHQKEIQTPKCFNATPKGEVKKLIKKHRQTNSSTAQKGSCTWTGWSD